VQKKRNFGPWRANKIWVFDLLPNPFSWDSATPAHPYGILKTATQTLFQVAQFPAEGNRLTGKRAPTPLRHLQATSVHQATDGPARRRGDPRGRSKGSICLKVRVELPPSSRFAGLRRDKGARRDQENKNRSGNPPDPQSLRDYRHADITRILISATSVLSAVQGLSYVRSL
jgi:hypothetical protein